VRRSIVIGGAALVVAAAIGAWWLARDAATPVEPDDLGEAFTGEVGDRPGGPGIYRFHTRGHETIDALQGARHDYPDETYLVITDASCGPLVTWRALAERWIEWSHCGPDLGVDATVEFHQWFGIPDEESERCDPARPIATPASSVVCTAAGSTETYSVEVVGIEEVDIGGTPVVTTHVRRTSRLSGGSEGTTTADIWRLADSTLIVRMEWTSSSVTTSLAGDVTYFEEVALELTGLLPTG
jgi:hypothetical protein